MILAACAGRGAETLPPTSPWLREACTTFPQRCAYDAARASHLFTVGYREISNIYIEPVKIPDLARAGLENLTALDPKLAIRYAGSVMTLLHEGRPAASFNLPAPSDAARWGNLTASLIADGRAASPYLAATAVERLYKAAFDGMASRLDRYSGYASRSEVRGNHAGDAGAGDIGVRVRVVAEGVRILSVMADTPAAEAGLRARDLITEIDGTSVIGAPPQEVLRRLRGPVRSEVALRILRQSQERSFPVAVRRARTASPSVTYRADGPIAYIRVFKFDRNTGRFVRYKLKQARRDLGGKLVGFIVDLRGNPGGLFDQAVQVADLFLDEGRIVSAHGRHPDSEQTFDAEPGELAAGRPVVVLIDGHSASASEIVAAALQDAGRAVLVGSTTFGKGTVQTVRQLPNAGQLMLTWAKFYAPSGYGLNHSGVLPDLCTAGAARAPGELLEGLRGRKAPPRGHAGPPAQEVKDLARSPAARADCPRDADEPEVDLELARALLGDPRLYARALSPTPRAPAGDPSALQANFEPGCRPDSAMPAGQAGAC